MCEKALRMDVACCPISNRGQRASQQASGSAGQRGQARPQQGKLSHQDDSALPGLRQIAFRMRGGNCRR